MDRVFMHVRCVRCPTCSRVFCCVKHRVAHERRAHVIQAMSGVHMPVIRRRFRSAATPERVRGTAAVGSGHGRKRLHAASDGGLADRRRAPHQPRQWPKDTPVRTILKARRSSLSSVKLPPRPVAESSPAVVPAPSANAEVCTPVDRSAADSSASYYQTPMQTPSVSLSLLGSSGSAAATAAAAAAAAEDDTPTAYRNGGKAKRPVSSGHNSAQKGFFWSNMARRFRLALRPAKPKVRDSSSSPPVTNVDMVKYYDNIQPRRPIKNDELTPVDPRPSLEVLRQAHEEANRAMNNKSD